MEPNQKYSDHYVLKGNIGQGGIGRVLLAFDQSLGREVAIKELLISKDDPLYEEVASRFNREVLITGNLEHPSIVPVYQKGNKEDGSQYYVMKFIRGYTFEQAINECTEDTKEKSLKNRLQLLDNFIRVCEAIAYAHDKGIIHRDIKPSNIVLGPFSETIILDWGLAKHLDEADDILSGETTNFSGMNDANLTGSGEILGTPSYMSPEQVDNRFGKINKSSDVYSLGCILFHILTGAPPYTGNTNNILAQLISDSPPPSLDSESLPQELAAICKKAISKKQNDRFANADELARQLRSFRAGRLVNVYAYTKSELLKRFISRNKPLIISLAAIFVSIIIGLIFSIHFAREAQQERLKAETARAQEREARLVAETALADVARMSNNTLQVSKQITHRLQNIIDSLRKDLELSARSLSISGFTNTEATLSQLRSLKGKHPFVESLVSIVTPGIINNAYPPKYSTIIGSDISAQPHIRLLLKGKSGFSRVFKAVENFHGVTLQVPVIGQGRTIGGISALMKTTELIPLAFDSETGKEPLQIWCMQDDSRLIYDDNPAEIGNMLLENEIYKDFPELIAFIKRMMTEEEGTGYYFYYETGGKRIIHKVGSWHTLRPGGDVQWKIVVIQPYFTKVVDLHSHGAPTKPNPWHKKY